jgi:hypothetical protein
MQAQCHQYGNGLSRVNRHPSGCRKDVMGVEVELLEHRGSSEALQNRANDVGYGGMGRVGEIEPLPDGRVESPTDAETVKDFRLGHVRGQDPTRTAGAACQRRVGVDLTYSSGHEGASPAA